MHGPETIFFKYLSPEASVAVLEHGTLKWACPKHFNDPFDFPTNIDFRFSEGDLADAVSREFQAIVYGQVEPTGDVSNEIFALGIAARKNPKKPPADVAEKFFNEKIRPELMKDFWPSIERRRKFFSQFREEFSVLCLSTTNDNLLMWAHYCNGHQGCVLGFQCLPDLDRPICAAQPVTYLPEYPAFASLQDFVRQATGQINLDYDELARLFFFSKSNHWAYEREWRCTWALDDKQRGFDLVPWIPEELESVHIGSSASAAFTKHIVDVVMLKSPKTKVFQARPELQNYSVAFDRVY